MPQQQFGHGVKDPSFPRRAPATFPTFTHGTSM